MTKGIAERVDELVTSAYGAQTFAYHAAPLLREAAAELRRLEGLVGTLKMTEGGMIWKFRVKQAEAEVARLRAALQLIAGDGPLPPSKCCSQCVARATLSGASAQGPEE